MPWDSVVPAGKIPEDFRGDIHDGRSAVASLGEAVEHRSPHPNRKLITVANKAGSLKLVSAVVGTPIGDILQAIGITMEEKDRLVIGGPMTGKAVYSEDFPVEPDTSAIIVQDRSDVSYVSDYPCINCGDCIRICPVDIPVNMLVRFLGGRAVRTMPLDHVSDLSSSCIECGLLLSFVLRVQDSHISVYPVGQVRN